MKIEAATVGAYLSALPGEQKKALQKLRKTIRAAAPDASECISYGIPAYRLDGRFLLGFGAAKTHCAFYPGSALRQFKVKLAGFSTSTGTIRFTPGKPLPAALVRAIVKARIAQLKNSRRAGRFSGAPTQSRGD